MNASGGRFNIGKISPNIPKFAALYIANNKETAIREAFQVGPTNKKRGLSDEDLALLKAKSFCIVTVYGKLDQVFDLTEKHLLNDFFNAIKYIRLSEKLTEKAKKLNIDPRPEIKTLTQLYNSIFENDYKIHSLLFDQPSNSQILGHIVFEAGIQAIKYPSKFTRGHCLAIYPLNFEENDSYLSINEQEAPNEININQRKLDKTNFNNFI